MHGPSKKEEQFLFPPEIMNKPKTYFRFICYVSRSSHSFKGFEQFFFFLLEKSDILRTKENRENGKNQEIIVIPGDYEERNLGVKISLETSFSTMLILAASLLSNSVCFSFAENMTLGLRFSKPRLPHCV